MCAVAGDVISFNSFFLFKFNFITTVFFKPFWTGYFSSSLCACFHRVKCLSYFCFIYLSCPTTKDIKTTQTDVSYSWNSQSVFLVLTSTRLLLLGFSCQFLTIFSSFESFWLTSETLTFALASLHAFCWLWILAGSEDLCFPVVAFCLSQKDKWDWCVKEGLQFFGNVIQLDKLGQWSTRGWFLHIHSLPPPALIGSVLGSWARQMFETLLLVW